MIANSSSNTSHYKSEGFDKLMAKALAAKTEDERASVYREAKRCWRKMRLSFRFTTTRIPVWLNRMWAA